MCIRVSEKPSAHILKSYRQENFINNHFTVPVFVYLCAHLCLTAQINGEAWSCLVCVSPVALCA